MFNKKSFSNVIQNILQYYENSTEFSETANVNRTYISKYINEKLDNPPTPKILKRIADSSKGTVTYAQLMEICGYLEKIDVKDIKKQQFLFRKNQFTKLELTDSEINEILNFFIEGDYNKLEDYLASHDDIIIDAVINALQEITLDVAAVLNDRREAATQLLTETEELKEKVKSVLNVHKHNHLPVLGRIPAGIPIEMIEDVIDYEDISEDMLKGGKEYFALKIKGDSMNPDYLENDIIIVLKQSDCESGQDCVVAVNGDDATFKRVFKTDQGITLQPLNNRYMPVFYSNEDIINKPIKILGVVKQVRRNK